MSYRGRGRRKRRSHAAELSVRLTMDQVPELPRTDYHVVVGNPSDATIRYSQVVEYLTPSI